MDSSETSSNTQLSSSFSNPLSGGPPRSDLEPSPDAGQAAGSDDANLSPARVRSAQEPSPPDSDRLRSRQVKHRIAEVRDSQGVSLRTISRRSGIAVRILRQQEEPHTDLRISQLTAWAEALEVPVGELLAEPHDSLCASIAQRAQMVRLMKTVEAMRAHAQVGSVRRISDVMRQQLLEIMPELEDVTAWPKEGSRRPNGGVGRIAAQPVPTERIEPPAGRDSVG